MMMRKDPLVLMILAQQLQVAPPSIHYLIGLLEQSETLQGFLDLVREFLPDHETEIMALDRMGRIEAFETFFGTRYFQLQESSAWADEDDEGYIDLLNSIPIPHMAISYDDFHDLEAFRMGVQLLMVLVESPFYEDGQVALMEQCAQHVDRPLMRRVRRGGWPLEELHRLLDDTPYAGAALFGDCLHRNTDTIFLDCDWEEEAQIDWTRANVDELTEKFQHVLRIQRETFGLSEWLEEDPKGNFKQILDALGAKEVTEVPPVKTLIQVLT